MQTFPRLMDVLEKPITDLTADDIVRAVQNRVVEAVDLEWKSALYDTSGASTFELAKDVAAFANAAGGILVLGVDEDDACAGDVKPVRLTSEEETRMKQVLNSRVFPHIVGIEIRQLALPSSPGSGFFLIVVPRSADAPHAVTKSAETFCYPVRDGLTTRYLREAEIGSRYRDRYTARAGMASMLQRVHEEGRDRLFRGKQWLAVSLYPALPANNPSGSASIASAEGLAHSWTRYVAPPVGRLGNFRAVPGVRRAILTADQQYSGVTTQQPHAQLHFNGAGFVGLAAPHAVDPMHTNLDLGDADKLAQDELELRLMASVSLLAHYAAHVGAGGDCEVQAQLVMRDHHRMPSGYPGSAAMFVPDCLGDSSFRNTYVHAPGSLKLSHHPVATAVTGNLDELAGNAGVVVQTAHALATDILNQFAIADPCVLRADGRLNTDRTYAQTQGPMEEWAVRNLAGW